MNIFGSTPVSTSAAGATLTISVANATTAATGVASFNPLDFTVNGSGQVTLISSVALTFTGNSGSATPSGNNLNILGNDPLSVAGSGSTLTISLSGTGYVSAIRGTADQVYANGTSGVSQTSIVTLTLPQSIATTSTVQFGKLGVNVTASNNSFSVNGSASIGNADTAAPTNGLLVTGLANFGITTTDAAGAVITVGIGQGRAISIVGTKTGNDGGSNQLGFIDNTIYASVTGSIFAMSIATNADFRTPTGQTVTNAGGMTVFNTVSSNVGSITNLFGLYIRSGSAGAGTIGTSYGAYITQQAAGTTKIGLYADNIAIGTIGTAPPTNGLLVLGNILNSALSASSIVTTDASKNLTTTAIPLSIANGGTNATSMATTDGVVYFDGTRLVTTSAGTANFVLTSNGAGLAPTYQALSGLAVTSITGTANQVIASASIGAVTLSTPQDIAITSTVQFGKLGLGVAAASTTILEATGTTAYIAYLRGTQASVSSSTQATIYLDGTLLPTSGSTTSAGLYINQVVNAPGGQTITSAIGAYLNSTYAGNAGTITTGYSLLVGAGTAASGVSLAYGGYFTKPASGTIKVSLYSDDLSVGYTGAAPPTNGLQVSGLATFGTSTTDVAGSEVTVGIGQGRSVSIVGTKTGNDGGSNQVGFIDNTIYAPVTGSTFSMSLNTNADFRVPNGQTVTAAGGVSIFNTLTNNVGTITTLYGIFVRAGTGSAGTIGTSYGAYITQQSAGSTKIALYADNVAIGTAGTAPPTNGLLVNGSILNSALSASSLVATDALKNLVSLADPLTVTHGGTGSANFTAYGPVVAASTTTGALTSVTPSATSGVPFISQGSSTLPAFGTAVVAGGGTGNTTFTAYAVICAGTTSTGAFQNVSGVGTSGQYLKSNGASNLPSWADLPAAGVTSITGTPNQVIASASTGAVTLSTPQDIGTSSTVQFAKLGLGVAASNNQLSINGKASIGYSDTAAPTNGLIVAGVVGIGTSSPSSGISLTITNASAYGIYTIGTQAGVDGGNNQLSCALQGTMSPTNGGNIIAQLACGGNFAAPSTKTIALTAGIYVNNSYSGNAGTITNSYGVIIDVGGAGSGTITNAYGLWVGNTGSGSTNYCAHFEGPIDYAGGTCVANPPSGAITSSLIVRIDGALRYIPFYSAHT